MSSSLFDDSDDWQDMPVIKSEESVLDEEDRKRFHYIAPQKRRPSPSLETEEPTSPVTARSAANDFENWREKEDVTDELDYTRLELDEDPEEDAIHTRTQYLFSDEKGMTPLSQMQATKTLLSEGQRIAYIGLCRLVTCEMIANITAGAHKELDPAAESARNWATKIMGRLYQHMEITPSEQRMIEQLAEHGVTPADLTPSLLTTHTVPNPEYDPEAAKEREEEHRLQEEREAKEESAESSQASLDGASKEQEEGQDDVAGERNSPPGSGTQSNTDDAEDNLIAPLPSTLPGVSTTLSAADEMITLDIRWTILCDLFLALIADSVYDARSRVLLGRTAERMGLGWTDVIRFERRLTEALEIQEGVQKVQPGDVLEDRRKLGRNKRYMMMGLATLGGGLVIGLSAGLLAPLIGAGLGAAFTTIGVTGTTGFLAGTGGAAVITTGGVLTGSSIAAKGMARRTKHVRTFEFKPLHNNKRVSCYITIPGFMEGKLDDVRLPFSVMDPLMGDVFSVLWEPEMMGDTGNILKILTSEVLSQVGQQVLQATIMTALMSALQWPFLLTKLGYLIDNPWSNALDRARAAGAILADILIKRQVGVRPVSLIGFSLGARVIFYALVELAKAKAFGIVQEVYLLGATVTAPPRTWRAVRGVVSGRFVNGFARNDWILGYLFRATSGGLNTVAGLRPVEHVPDLENIDLTSIVIGHMGYRTSMPLVLQHLGFRVTRLYFDEPDHNERPDREVLRPVEDELKTRVENAGKSASASATGAKAPVEPYTEDDDTFVPDPSKVKSDIPSTDSADQASKDIADQAQPGVGPVPAEPIPSSYDFAAIKEELSKAEAQDVELPLPTNHTTDARDRDQYLARTPTQEYLPSPAEQSEASDSWDSTTPYSNGGPTISFADINGTISLGDDDGVVSQNVWSQPNGSNWDGRWDGRPRPDQSQSAW